MRISDWSSDVCSSDLEGGGALALFQAARMGGEPAAPCPPFRVAATRCGGGAAGAADGRGGGGAAGAARLCGCGGGDFPAQGASRPAQYAAGGGGDGDRQDPR